MTTAISEDLRARRSEIVTQHIDAENRHDPDGVSPASTSPTTTSRRSATRDR